MKDFYYILGLTKNATDFEIKTAHRKLSHKFHPDKNEGDHFFTERFKEIQEAYEILINPLTRSDYDNEVEKTQNGKSSNTGLNFLPEIEFFNTDKLSFKFDEEICFSWKTINANKVLLTPFGNVESIDTKKYKIRDFKNEQITFELIAENTNINRQIKSTITLTNKTYHELFLHFKNEIDLENRSKNDLNKERTKNSNQPTNMVSNWWTVLYIVIVLIAAAIALLTN